METSPQNKMYALIQWEDMYFDVLCTSRIDEPRKAIDGYKEGEYIKAKYKGKPYSAVICELSADRSVLLPKKGKETKFVYEEQPSRKDNEIKENSSKSTTDKEDNKTQEPTSKKRKREETDEVKAADNKCKKIKAMERDAASASIINLLDEGPIMDILKNMQSKIDKTHDMVESVLNCKQCLRKCYKGLDTKDWSLQSVEKPAVIKKTSESSLENHQPVSGRLLSTTLGANATLEITDLPDNAELDIVLSSDSDLVYVGETHLNVKVAREKLTRCEKTAKSAEKLALNLVEVVLSQEEIKTATIYGNSQHGKKEIDPKKRQALRTHIFSKFKEADWEKIVKIMNDKIRKLKKKMEEL